MIRKPITCLLLAVFLVILTLAWTPQAAHAQCIAGLNGLICPPPPAPTAGTSGGSSSGHHKRSSQTPLPTPTLTPIPTPTSAPASLPPLYGQAGPSDGNAGAAPNPNQGSSGFLWKATLLEYWWLALILILVPAVAGLLIGSRMHRGNPVLVDGTSAVDRDAGTGLPGGNRNHKPTLSSTSDATGEGSSVIQSQDRWPLPPGPTPSPPPIPYPNAVSKDVAAGKVVPSDSTITKTVDQGSATISK